MSLSRLIGTFLGGAGEVWEVLFTDADPARTIELSRSLRRVSEQAVSSLAEGFELAQRLSIRNEESLRRTFFDRLLSSESAKAELEEIAERIGFPPVEQAAVAVAVGDRHTADAGPAHRRIRSELTSRAPERNLSVTSMDGRIVIIAVETTTADLARLVGSVFADSDDPLWRVGIGDSVDALESVSLSYQQALEAHHIGARFGLTSPVEFSKILPERLLSGDASVAEALVRSVIEPLVQKPKNDLLPTLESFIEHGGNMAEVARALNIGARTVAYRLDKIAAVTGYSPRRADERFVLELAYRMSPAVPPGHRGRSD